MDVKRVVGSNLRRLRKAAELTQEQLAERSGFSQQYLSETENGKRNPSVVSLYEIAKALGLELWQLVQTDDLMSVDLARRYIAMAKAGELTTVPLELYTPPDKMPARVGSVDDAPKRSSNR